MTDIQTNNPRDHFLGAWKLLTYEYRDDTGFISYPFGQDTNGVIMYDASGMMSVQIIRLDRPNFASGDMFNGTQAEIKAAFEGINTYFGMFEVDEAAKTVTHHLLNASFPNRAQVAQVREYDFSGNRLTLKAPARLLHGKLLTGVLVWERV